MRTERVATFLIAFVIGYSSGHSHNLVYQWVDIELNWPNNSMRDEWINSKKFIKENNAINGIKVYKGEIYLTLPSLKDGAPITLVKVVKNESNMSPILQPYPSWEMHDKQDCNKLQLVQSMEIDPNTGWMWILDTAYVPRGQVEVAERCLSKLIIYDINMDKEIHRYVFPKSLLGPGMYYLNDIVLDYVDGKASYAYISDTLGRRLFVYDHQMNSSHAFEDSSMAPEQNQGTLRISNETSQVGVLGINGIAISSDFRFVYYSAVAGISVYQIPTSVLRNAEKNNFGSSVRKVGEKMVQGDGMFYGQKNLYFTTLGKNAVYKWEVENDMMKVGDYGKVKFETQTEVVKDMRMQWIDSLAIDENNHLWFTSNNLHTFFGNETQNATWNYFVWKINIDEGSYLATAQKPTGDAHNVKVTFMLQFFTLAVYFACT